MVPVMLAGRYRLVRRIATGGMGTVHEAVDERLGRRVAVKVLKPEYASDPGFVERFSREARATAALAHPHIAQVYDSGRDGDLHFIVMQFVEGEHLGEVLQREGRIHPRRAVEFAGQVCSALAAAHAVGIVHRDIKPGNVMIRPDGQVMVTDFGIAHSLGQATLTEAGSVLGTAKYLSPEQASGEPVTPRSDVYAVGILCFEMLTGRVPFDGDTPLAVALSHIRDEVPDVREVVESVPVPLASVVSRATAKDPQHRYADGGDMERALRALSAGAEPPTLVLPTEPPHPPTAPTLQLATRRPAVARRWPRVAAGLLAAGVLAVGWAAWRGQSPVSAPEPTIPEASSAASTPSAQPSPQDPVTTDAATQQPTEPPEGTAAATTQGTGNSVPQDAVGSDARDLEEDLKAQGIDVQRVAVGVDAPKDSVVATIPDPGATIAEGQSVVLIASQGGKPKNPQPPIVVPDNLLGADVKEARELLKAPGVEVKTVDIDADSPKDTVVAMYPSAGTATDVVVLVVSRGE